MADGGFHGPPVRARYDAGWPSDYNPSPPVARSPDDELYAAGARLRDWARYLAKNSSIAIAVLDSRESKGIGEGLRYEPLVRARGKDGRPGNLLPEVNAAIRREHARWSEAADVTGELSRQEVERLVWRDWDVAGEVFARKVFRGRAAGRLGYQLQLIRSELVPYAFLGQGGAHMGIERDEWGAPVRYWVLPVAPGSDLWRFSQKSFQPKDIAADQMVHLRRQLELGQTRGVTLFHGVIFRISDIAEYQQSHRRAARASANLFAAINRSPDYQPGEDDERGNARPSELNLNELTVLDYLKPGESAEFLSPSHPNVNAIEFVNQELRQLAASCRVAFSWIAFVFDRAYAAQRTEHTHAWGMIYEDRAHFVRDFAYPALYREPLRLAMLEKRLPARELRRADPDTLFDVRIDGPTMPSINPVDDRRAAEIDQERGWDSRQAIIRRFGREPSQVDAERQQDPYLQAGSILVERGEVRRSEQADPEEDQGADESE